MSKIYYDAEFAAAGGPPPAGPTVKPEHLIDEFAGPFTGGIAIVYDTTRDVHVIADVATGSVFAEARDLTELLPWLRVYATDLQNAMDEDRVAPVDDWAPCDGASHPLCCR